MFGLTSSELDTLIVVQRDSSTSLGRQLEDQLRDAVRRGALAAGSVLPSTRDLARQLGISRPLVGNAYSQLAAEGFVVLRQGALPRVARQGGRQARWLRKGSNGVAARLAAYRSSAVQQAGPRGGVRRTAEDELRVAACDPKTSAFQSSPSSFSSF